MLGIGDDHVERDRENGGNHQHFEHKIVQSSYEKRAERLGLNGLSMVVTEVGGSLGVVRACETNLGVHPERLGKPLNTCREGSCETEFRDLPPK